MKLWGGRFETGPSEVFERFSNSLHFDRRLLDADVRGSQAFARSLARAGVLTADECADIVAGVRMPSVEECRLAGLLRRRRPTKMSTRFVIRKLKERVGALADKIHTGRSRNEQVSLDTRLWLREECDHARELLQRTDGRAARSGRQAIPTPSFPATRICAAPSPCSGRITCWRISKCSRAITSASAKRAAAPT